jgi:hypothetical protein
MAMPLTEPPRALPGFIDTSADREAARNWAANLRAMVRTQTALVRQVEAIAPRLAWLFGRDGALTGRDAEGRWLAGCTLPRRAAAEMLREIKITGRTACFLAPPHAAHLRVVLDMLDSSQCLIAVVPDLRMLRAMLSCEDFSADIRRHRLWFCGGADWSAQMQRLLERHPGLAVPQQFIRTAMTPEPLLQALGREAEQVIQSITTRRAERRTIAIGSPFAPPICCIAGSTFRLWDGAANALAKTMTAVLPPAQVRRFDPDDPLCAAPGALLDAAEGCGAVFSADTGRSDVPKVLPNELPWITWAVNRVPDFSSAAPVDRLLLAEAAMQRAAEQAGWPAERVALASWPDSLSFKESAGATGCDVPPQRSPNPHPDGEATDLRSAPEPALALIIDTHDLAVPEAHEHYSSHRLLWDSIREELLADPFQLHDPAEYLAQRMRRHGVLEEGFDRAAFIAQLLLPAYQQGIARALIAAGVPLNLHGRGWGQIDQFAAHAAGPVEDAESMERAVCSSSGLVSPWPCVMPPELRALGRPVLRGSSRIDLLQQARSILHRAAQDRHPAPCRASLADALRAILCPPGR